jgi:hypothetical protein
MGIFDRFGRGDATGSEGQRTALSEDEQALARYRYMLKTAPPETIEQAHVEAFAQLTPQQRRMLLEQLRDEMPAAERAYAADDPQTLARVATRAELRQPGTLEHVFGRMPAAAPGLGGMMAGSLLSSMAGAVLGTMIAESFLGHHGGLQGEHGLGQAADWSPDRDSGSDLHDGGDTAGGFDDLGTDFDPGSLDV